MPLPPLVTQKSHVFSEKLMSVNQRTMPSSQTGTFEEANAEMYMVISIKMPLPGRSLNLNCAARELLRCTFRRRSPFIRINRTAFSFGKKLYSKWCSVTVANPSLRANSKKLAWSLRSSSDGGGLLNPSTETSGTDSGTRLNRAIRAIRFNFSSKVKEIRKHFAMKLLFFLVGFYCATAFATVIGQTGDWDILSAALAVVIVEGIGALMYKVLTCATRDSDFGKHRESKGLWC